MHMIFIAPSYYPHIGGVEYVVKSVAERLAKADHEANIIRYLLCIRELRIIKVMIPFCELGLEDSMM